MKITLDAKAIRELIGDDEEMKLELGRAVVSEIVRKLVIKDGNEIVKFLAPKPLAKLCEEMGMRKSIEDHIDGAVRRLTAGKGYSHDPHRKLTEQAKDMVNQAVREHVKTYLEDVAKQRVELMKDLQEKITDGLAAEVERRMDYMFDMYFKRDVKAEVDRRLRAAAGGE